MKKIIPFAIAASLLCGCDDDFKPYVVDFDYSAIYVAYQYDLRSFVVGEGMKIEFGSVLGGVLENDKDRKVQFVVDDALVTGDLIEYGGEKHFTAYNGMLGNAGAGTLSQTYVTDAVNAAGISALTPLPSNLYSLSRTESMTIQKGRHTATVTMRPDSAAFLADAHVGIKPYYALGYRIVSADADTVLKDRSFSVIAFRYENQFFGYWYHSGKSVVKDNSGKIISQESYVGQAPADANTSAIYQLSTTSAYGLSCNCFHNDNSRKMAITSKGDNLEVSSDDGTIVDNGSNWNHAVLLQDRELYLNYQYPDPQGNTVTVTDTLRFRNRIRDGVNEWQDEVTGHYKN